MKMENKVLGIKRTALEKLKKKERKDLDSMIREYMYFIDHGKTPENTVSRALVYAKAGFMREYEDGMKMENAPRGVYMTDADQRQFALILPGKEKARDSGITMFGAHTDSPCFNLKCSNPIRAAPEGAILAAKPCGGIWPHTWVDTQVTVIGRVKYGSKIIDFEQDGLFSERSVHIARKDVAPKKLGAAFPHEMFKIITGYPTKEAYLNNLKKQGLDEKCFFRGSWYAVPKANSRHIGEELIDGYGHDDRICIFTGVKAALESKNRRYPAVIYGCHREEVGSTGYDGAQGEFFDLATDALLKLEGMKEEDISNAVKRSVYKKSRMISADVGIPLNSYDLQYQDQFSAARFGGGICLFKANGGPYQSNGNLASDEMTAYTMDLLDKTGVIYQLAETPSKLEVGGGGTISKFFAQRGIPVIDAGPAISNMHGKTSQAHIGDLYQSFKAYRSFIERKD